MVVQGYLNACWARLAPPEVHLAGRGGADHAQSIRKAPGIHEKKPVTPGKINQLHLKMDVWKAIFLYNPVVVRFHVGLFQGQISGHRRVHSTL